MLPALNEEDTVADVIASIMPLYPHPSTRRVVLDSCSTDATAERATAAGARAGDQPEGGRSRTSEPVKGKGEVLYGRDRGRRWRSDRLVDSDLIDPDPMFVPRCSDRC